MAYAFNQMTQREALQQAEALSESGTVRWSIVRMEDGTWNVMPAEIAAIERGVSTEMAESVFNPSSIGECRAFCAAATAVTTPLFGDISGGPSSDQLNMSSNVAARSEKALDLLQQHPNESVAGFAKGLSRAPSPVRYSLIVPAGMNNYRGCFDECRSHYFDRRGQ